MTDKPHHPLNVKGEERAFFGRRSGKRLHKGQDRLFKDLLPQVSIGFKYEMDPVAPLVPFANPTAPLELEIGYGGGEHLARMAVANPGTNYFGAEVFSGGIAKLLQKIDEDGLTNIRVYSFDAIVLLRDLPDASLHGAYLLYPDPWPKTRHHKRRFISPTTLRELARVLKPGAVFRVATDIEDYATWTLAHVLRARQFRFAPGAPGEWHTPFVGWEPTRYEDKARAEGRLRSFYMSFTRL